MSDTEKLSIQEYYEKLNAAGSEIKAGEYPQADTLEGLPEATVSWLHRLYVLPTEKRDNLWNADREASGADSGKQSRWEDLEAPVKKILRFSDLEDMPSYEWLEEGFLPASGLSIIYGKRGSGKSLFAFYLCAKYATEGYRTLYVATEGMRSVYPRGRACVEINQLDWESVDENFRFYNFNALPTPRLDDIDSAARMIEIANQMKPNMVVFDIFGDTFSGDENSKEGMDLPLEAASKISHAMDCSVILVHHAGKDQSRGARGHSRLEDKAEVVIRVHPAQDNDNIKGFVYVSCEKMREAEPFERQLFKIEQSDSSAAFTPADSVKLPPKLSPSQYKVYQYVEGNPNCGLTEILLKVGYSKQTVVDALNKLVKTETIHKTQDRKYVVESERT